MSIEKEAEAFVSEKADKGNFDVEKFGKAYFSESSMKQALVKFAEPREKRIEELEKENAELKGLKDVATLIRANNDTVTTLMQLNNMLVSKSQQLTKAKEILKRFIETSNPIYFEEDRQKVKAQAEQYLKEIEK